MATGKGELRWDDKRAHHRGDRAAVARPFPPKGTTEGCRGLLSAEDNGGLPYSREKAVADSRLLSGERVDQTLGAAQARG